MAFVRDGVRRFEGAWVNQSSWQTVGGVSKEVQTKMWSDKATTSTPASQIVQPQPAPPKGKTYTGPTKYAPVGTATVAKATTTATTSTPTTWADRVAAEPPHRLEDQGTAWQTVNGVAKEVAQPAKDWGRIVTDVSQFPAMPADYPTALRSSPTKPLDAYLPAGPSGSSTQYGGLSESQWNWISWRKRYLWGIPSMDPGSRAAAVALMSSREQSFLNADTAHKNKQWSTEKTIGVGIGIALAGTVAAGVITSVAAAGAVSAAGSSAAAGTTTAAVPVSTVAAAVPTAATSTAEVITTAPSLATMAGSGSMAGGFGAGIGGASAVVPTSLAGVVGTTTTASVLESAATAAAGVGTSTAATGGGVAAVGAAAAKAAVGVVSSAVVPKVLAAVGLGQQTASSGATVSLPTSAEQTAAQSGLLDQLGLGNVSPIVLIGGGLLLLFALTR